MVHWLKTMPLYFSYWLHFYILKFLRKAQKSFWLLKWCRKLETQHTFIFTLLSHHLIAKTAKNTKRNRTKGKLNRDLRVSEAEENKKKDKETDGKWQWAGLCRTFLIKATDLLPNAIALMPHCNLKTNRFVSLKTAALQKYYLGLLQPFTQLQLSQPQWIH